jgi:hypothetical protein
MPAMTGKMQRAPTPCKAFDDGFYLNRATRIYAATPPTNNCSGAACGE